MPLKCAALLSGAVGDVDGAKTGWRMTSGWLRKSARLCRRGKERSSTAKRITWLEAGAPVAGKLKTGKLVFGAEAIALDAAAIKLSNITRNI